MCVQLWFDNYLMNDYDDVIKMMVINIGAVYADEGPASATGNTHRRNDGAMETRLGISAIQSVSLFFSLFSVQENLILKLVVIMFRY